MGGAALADCIVRYFNSVCEAYRLGNIESSYNEPIIALLTHFGCTARDMSGERSGQSGENIDIKLWHNDEDVTTFEPFAGIEVKKLKVLMTVPGHKLKLKQAAIALRFLPTILYGSSGGLVKPKCILESSLSS